MTQEEAISSVTSSMLSVDLTSFTGFTGFTGFTLVYIQHSVNLFNFPGHQGLSKTSSNFPGKLLLNGCAGDGCPGRAGDYGPFFHDCAGGHAALLTDPRDHERAGDVRHEREDVRGP